jgi:hypothetical protein
MDIASSEIVSFIDRHKSSIKTREQEENIATISANNDSEL